MSVNFNAASRSHEILTEAMRQNPNTPALQVWASVFNISINNPISKMFEIAKMVDHLYKQLEKVRGEMSSQKISPEKYNPIIDRIQSALSIDAPNNPWSNYVQHLHAYTLETLSQYADLISDEGKAIPQEEIDELMEIMNDLENQVRSGDLTAEAKNFINRNIDIIRDALRLYRIDGNSAFTEAVSQSITTIATNQEVIRRYANDPEFKGAIAQIGSAWSKIKNYSPDIQTALALIQGSQLLTEGGKMVFGLLAGS